MMPSFSRPRSSSSPPPGLPRLHVKSLDLSLDWNWYAKATSAGGNSTPAGLKVPPQATSPPPLRNSLPPSSRKSFTTPTSTTKARLDKIGVAVAWEEIIARNRSKINFSSEKRRTASETVSAPQKKVLKKPVPAEKGKKRKRVVSPQLPLPSMPGQMKSWRSASNMRNMEEGVGAGGGRERGREVQIKAGNVKAMSMNSRTVGFGYESYTASTQPMPMPIPMPKPDNKGRNCSSRMGRRIREPEESWLDLDDSPASTIGRTTPVNILSTTVVTPPPQPPPPQPPSPPSPPSPPITPPSSVESSDALKTLIQTHLTTTLLSLEIDIAQLDTRLFLIFDQLRTVHTSLLRRIPGITMAPSKTSPAPTISTTEGKFQLRTLRTELGAIGVEIMGFMETISIVEMQIVEALEEEDISAEGAVVEEESVRGAGELRRQVKTVKTELGRLERKRRGLGEWAGEVWVGWNFGTGEEEDLEEKTQVPVLTVGRTQSAPVTPVSGPSYLTVPERSDVALDRNRSIRGSRSMGSIKINPFSASSSSFSNRNSDSIIRRKPVPLNVNKPLPASPGDGDFEMETRYIRERSRSRSPAPPPLGHDAEPLWGEQCPTSPRPPTIPERNPRRIIPRTGPPPEPEFDVGLALSVPSSNTGSAHLPLHLHTTNPPVVSAAPRPQLQLGNSDERRYSFASITDSTRLSLDLTNLDQLISSSARRSPSDVYHDFFSTHSVNSEDDSSYRSQYSRDEDEALRQERGNEEEDEEGEFELPPLLPSIGPDSVFSSANRYNNSSNKHNNRVSTASSCDNSSAPTTPGSASPATPYTPFTPFTPGPTFTPYANPHQRCSYSIYRKPIPPAQASPPSSASSTSQSQPENNFTFYSPSSFPQPPALKDLERKVRRENALPATVRWGANGADRNGQWQGGEYAYTYPEMEIGLLQCPPRGITYSTPVPPIPQPDPAPAPVALGSTPEKVGVWKRFGMKGGKDRDEGSHTQSQDHLHDWEDGTAGAAIGGAKEGKEGKRWGTKGITMGKGIGKNAFWRIRGGSKDLAKEERAVKIFSV